MDKPLLTVRNDLCFIFLLGLSVSVYAAEPIIKISTTTPGVTSETKPTSNSPNNVGPTSPNRVLTGEPTAHKNYWIPALEIPAFEFVLNQYDRWAYGLHDYGSTLASGWSHVEHGPWVVDQDNFDINQFGHPYAGTMYYGFARSSGLNFWEGLLYSNIGSFIWETYGETTKPSINDQVATGTGGALIGEPLYRMANLVLEGSEDKKHPGFWRGLGATIISPPTMFNRIVFGDQYTPILESRQPATLVRLQAGAGVNNTVKDPGSSRVLKHNIEVADFSLSYGLPGKPGYLYLRPFDYFDFELNGLDNNSTVYPNLMTRGLLFGKKYESGDDYRGVWGLYGSFDYLSPQVFNVSTTAASLGTTGQWWLSRKVALQGTSLGGIGYGAAGTITPQNLEKDYHYGATPQALLAFRLIFGKLAMWDTSARGYYISGTGASRAHGTEHITRVNTAFVVRIYGHHALGINYLLTTRDAYYSSASLSDRHQVVGTISLVYNYLSDIHFGAVEWGRKADDKE